MARLNKDRLQLHGLRVPYARERGLPSFDGILGALGFRTKAAAFTPMDRLGASGHVRSVAGGRLVPRHRFFHAAPSDDEVRAGIVMERPAPGLVDEQSLTKLLGSTHLQGRSWFGRAEN
jgi:hypothetical protein